MLPEESLLQYDAARRHAGATALRFGAQAFAGAADLEPADAALAVDGPKLRMTPNCA